MVFAGVLLLWGGAGWAQDTLGEPPLPSDLATLIAPEPERWMAALAEFRADPREAREKLVGALGAEVEAPTRWRIFHHMMEFGEAEDIPLLLHHLPAARDARERQILLGAAQALYRPVVGTTDLTNAVEEFAFTQTRRPERMEDPLVGRWPMGEQEFQAFHRVGIPIEPLTKLLRLKGRSYGSAKEVGKAMEKRLSEQEWAAHGAELVKMVERRQPRTVREGLLRFRVRNPLTLPLLLRVDFDAWGGGFSPQPETAYLFLEPGKTELVDIPARLIRPEGPAPLRIDMRMGEVRGALAPIFRKLYLSE